MRRSKLRTLAWTALVLLFLALSAILWISFIDWRVSRDLNQWLKANEPTAQDIPSPPKR